MEKLDKLLFIFVLVLGLSIEANLKAQDSLLVVSTKDNTLYQSESGDISNGKGDLFVGVTNNGEIRRSVIQFDLNDYNFSISDIDSVKLRVEVSKQASSGYSITVHEVTQDWGEGTSNASGDRGGGQGATATEGDATWLHSFYPNTFWSEVGGDFVEETIASINVKENSNFLYTEASDKFIELLSKWAENPDENYGILLKNEDETVSKNALRISTQDSLVSNSAIFPTFVVYHNGNGVIEESSVSNETSEAITSIALNQNYPNPFNPTTIISFELEKPANVSLEVFNVVGQRIAILADNQRMSAGANELIFDAKNIPSGIYLYRLTTAEGFSQSRKMMLIK